MIPTTTVAAIHREEKDDRVEWTLTLDGPEKVSISGLFIKTKGRMIQLVDKSGNPPELPKGFPGELFDDLEDMAIIMGENMSKPYGRLLLEVNDQELKKRMK